MALDGILLSKITHEIHQYLPARINKIYQISSTEILLQLNTNQGKKNLMISCHSIYNRITLSDRSFPTPNEPSNFVMLLRKHLESSKIINITQGGLDRWVRLDCDAHNELGDSVTFYLYIELMGKYANLIFCNQDYKILDALKRIPPFESNKRTLQPGALFKEAEVQLDKENPFNASTVNTDRTLVSQFHGFSPLLAKEIEYRLPSQSFEEIMSEIKASTSLYIHETEKDILFHCIPLTHLGQSVKKPLLLGLDTLYVQKEEKERIRDIAGDIYRFVRRALKHQKQKLPKLIQSYEEALDCEKWREFGDYLFANQHLETKGLKEITLTSWDDTPILIPLDPKLDIKGNAKKCFQTYNKRKKGQLHLEEQISICKKEIAYFEGLEEQLEFTNFKDTLEINQELITLGYIKEKKVKSKKVKKKKEVLPNITKWILDNGVTLSFGKNNLQNEALTFKIAKKSDLWFHAKDYHGAHVTLDTLEPDEDTLRLAAMVAAYFSKGRYSSSVPVNYCSVKSLKKIPGAKPGMVALSSYKTIYIDPDFSLIEEFIQSHS